MVEAMDPEVLESVIQRVEPYFEAGEVRRSVQPVAPHEPPPGLAAGDSGVSESGGR